MATIAAVAALMTALWRTSFDAPLAFQERVEISAPRRIEDLFVPDTRRAVVGEQQLIALGGDRTRALDLAVALTGSFTGSRRVRTEGLASAPSGRAVAGVSAAADPFSVEYGGLDRIELALDPPAPSRSWQFNLSPPVWRSGGADALTGRTPSIARAGGFLAGPGPHARLSFFAEADRLAQRDVPAIATSDGAILASAAARTTAMHSAAAGLAWASGTTLLRTSFAAASTHLDRAGVGPLAADSTAFSLRSEMRNGHVSWSMGTRVLHRGGVAVSSTSAAHEAYGSDAAAISPSLVVSGVEIMSRRTRLEEIEVRHVLHPPNRAWLAGFEGRHQSFTDARTYNPGGLTRFGADGSSVRFDVHPRGEARVGLSSAALFAQRILPLGRAAALRAGARADWLDGEGSFVSPRISIAARRARTTMSLSGAFAVEEWDAPALSELQWRDGSAAGWFVDDAALQLHRAPGFRRRRDVIVRGSLARGFGVLTAAADHTWSRGSHLSGTTRSRAGAVITDVLAADRRGERHQTHLSARAIMAGISLTTHYEWLHARDDTDGWLAISTPEFTRAAAPRHHASIVIAGAPRGIARFVAIVRVASGARYSVLSGLDPEGLGAFTDRGGYARHSHQLPRSSNVNVYISRTIRMRGLTFDAGLRIENAANVRTVDEVGRVLSTPLFGGVLSASPGRSIGAWASFSRR